MRSFSGRLVSAASLTPRMSGGTYHGGTFESCLGLSHYKPSTYILGHPHFRKPQILVIFGEYPAIRGLCQLYLLILGQDQSSIVFSPPTYVLRRCIDEGKKSGMNVRRWMVLRETCWRLTEFHGFPCFSSFLKITFYRFLFWLGSAKLWTCWPFHISSRSQDLPNNNQSQNSMILMVKNHGFPKFRFSLKSIHWIRWQKLRRQLHKLHQSSVGRELSEVPTSTYPRFLQNLWGRENHRSFECFRGVCTYYICLRIIILTYIIIYIYIMIIIL